MKSKNWLPWFPLLKNWKILIRLRAKTNILKFRIISENQKANKDILLLWTTFLQTKSKANYTNLAIADFFNFSFFVSSIKPRYCYKIDYIYIMYI